MHVGCVVLCLQYKLNIQWVPMVPQGVNGLWSAADLACTSASQIKNEWSYTSVPLIYLCGVNKDNFTSFPLHARTRATHKINFN